MQAEIALRNLKKLDNKKKILEEIRETYNQFFGLYNTGHHLYRINIKNRKEFMIRMQESGVMCGIHYSAAHLNPTYTMPYSVSFLKKSEKCHAETVSIPFHEMLAKQNVGRILKLTRRFAIMADD
jgi:dTDP-4-amino-4,6-dideoxygalactose transaminase